MLSQPAPPTNCVDEELTLDDVFFDMPMTPAVSRSGGKKSIIDHNDFREGTPSEKFTLEDATSSETVDCSRYHMHCA